MKRYLIALAIATTIILAGVWFVRSTNGEIETRFERLRHELKEQKANGSLPEQWKDVDLDKLKWTDCGMTLPTNMQIRVDTSMWLTDFWFVLAPATVFACLGAAYLWGRLFARRSG